MITMVRVLLVVAAASIVSWIFSGFAKQANDWLASALRWAFFSILTAVLYISILGHFSEVTLRSWILSRAPLTGVIFGVMENQRLTPVGVWGGVIIIVISILISPGLSLPYIVKALDRRRKNPSQEFIAGEFQADVISGLFTGLCFALVLVFRSTVG